MSNWKAGDKAICVDMRTAFGPTEQPNGRPVEGTLYLVAGITSVPNGLNAKVGLRLHGLPQLYDGIEIGWAESRFRKIVPACDRVAMEQEQEATK
jgi:hypothetical protein